jgi:hypothetical protein
MPTKTDPRPVSDSRRKTRESRPEPLPTWRNTRPRGNPELDARDLERSRERFESLLGR